MVLDGLVNGLFNIPYTNTLVTRFQEIVEHIANIENSGEFSEQIATWLPEELENVDGLRTLVQSSAEGCDDLEELLNAIVTEITQPDIPIEVAEVRIMSLHKSKGLSSPVVIIAGCMEGLLPSHPDPDLTPAEQQAEIEEQRRLFYVGITRVKAAPAENKPGVLYLTSSRRMGQADAMGSGIQPAYFRHGFAYVHASRFIQELGPNAPATQQG